MSVCLDTRYNGTKTMYHATSKENARSIVRSREMHCGSGGLLGAGIYFSMNPDAASRKRRGGGDQVVLSASVDLGTTGFFTEGDDLDRYDLDRHNVDSAKVAAPRRRDVFVVFDSDKVSDIEVHSGSISDSDSDSDSTDYGYSAKRRRY
eukprot:g3905.t1